MIRSLIIILGILLLTFSGCDEKEITPKPEYLIPEDTYINLLVELQLFDALVYTTEDSIYTDSLRAELFNYFEISEEEFRESNGYYQSNVTEHIVRLDSVLKAIEREQKRLNQSDDGLESLRR